MQTLVLSLLLALAPPTVSQPIKKGPRYSGSAEVITKDIPATAASIEVKIRTVPQMPAKSFWSWDYPWDDEAITFVSEGPNELVLRVPETPERTIPVKWTARETLDSEQIVVRTKVKAGKGPKPPPDPDPTGPSISWFSPTTGTVEAGVAIHGANLGGVKSVLFGGASAAFTQVSDTTISATVPPTARTGPITVTTAQGTAVSSVPFTVGVTPPPVTPPINEPGFHVLVKFDRDKFDRPADEQRILYSQAVRDFLDGACPQAKDGGKGYRIYPVPAVGVTEPWKSAYEANQGKLPVAVISDTTTGKSWGGSIDGMTAEQFIAKCNEVRGK